MNTLTYLVGNFFFPKLLMANRLKELHRRTNWLVLACALVLAGGVVMTLLFIYDNPSRPTVVVKPLRH